MDTQPTQQAAYGLNNFFKEIADSLKEAFNGKSNVIRSCIIIGIILILSAIYFSLFGVISNIILVLTVWSIIKSVKAKTFGADFKSALKSFWDGIVGKDIDKKGRIALFALTLGVPLILALINAPLVDTVGVCLFFAARSPEALPILLCDSVYGSMRQKNFNRTNSRRYFVGFAAGLIIFSTIFGSIRAVNDFNTGYMPSEDTELTMKAQPGTLGDLEKSIIDDFNKASDYNVIIELSSYTSDTGTPFRRYGLYPSDEYTADNYVNDAAVAKLVVYCSGFEDDSAIFSFDAGLPYFSTFDLSEKSDDCAELERFTTHVLKGILPALSNRKISKLYSDMYLPTREDYREIGKEKHVSYKWTTEGRMSIVRFGDDESCFITIYFMSGGGISASDGHFHLLFENLLAQAE